MSIVTTTSAVSILCDCPYTGKTREIRDSSERDHKRKIKLLKSLKETKEELVIARHVLVNTRHRLALLKKILCLELGYAVSPYILPEATWKDRVREKSYLKSELLKLVDCLQECDLDVLQPIQLSASTEDLLSAVQEKTLRHLYHDYTVYHSEMERQIGASLCEFFQLKENYENTLYHNKVMEQEIGARKRKISNLQRQFLENKHLIDYITNHHFKMVGCFVHAFPEENFPQKEVKKKNAMNSEALKFKKLWENSKLEKRMLLDSVHALKKKLENTNQRTIRAEKFCYQNIISSGVLARKLKEGIALRKIEPKKKDVFGEFSLIHYRSQRSQLDAAINENKYLKNFLRKAILSKTEDLKQYQQSLQSTAGRYRAILENIRNELIEKEKKEEPVPEKKTEKKKKK